MKFTTADGKQVKSEEEKNQDAVDSVMPSQTPSSTDGEISKNAMTFHGDTTQIDVRKGKPITLQESFEQDQASQQKKRHGCFFRGCMTVLGLLLLLILFLVGTVRALKKKATPYLGEAALPLPEVSVDTQTVANTQMTLEYIQGNQPIPASTEQLVLSKDDINQYIANYQLTHNLPGQVYVNFPVENSAVVY